MRISFKKFANIFPSVAGLLKNFLDKIRGSSPVILKKFADFLQKFIYIGRNVRHRRHHRLRAEIRDESAHRSERIAENIRDFSADTRNRIRNGQSGDKRRNDVKSYRQNSPDNHREKIFQNGSGISAEGAGKSSQTRRQFFYKKLKKFIARAREMVNIYIGRKFKLRFIFSLKFLSKFNHSRKSVGDCGFACLFEFFAFRIESSALLHHFRELPRDFSAFFVLVNFFRLRHHLQKIICKFALVVVLVVRLGDSQHLLKIFCQFGLFFVFLAHHRHLAEKFFLSLIETLRRVNLKIPCL